MPEVFLDASDSTPILKWCEKVLNIFDKRLYKDETYLLNSGRVLSEDDALQVITPWAKNHLTRVGCLSGYDRVKLPNYFAIRPKAKEATFIVSLGKGIDKNKALLSAIFESFERWAAEEFESPKIYDSAINLIKNYPEYIVSLNSKLFNDTEKLVWVVGYDLLTNKPCFIPFVNVVFPYPKDFPTSNKFISDSNGLASGSSFSESILHALFEIIERDSIGKRSLKNSTCIKNNSIPKIHEDTINTFKNNGIDISIFERSIYQNLNVFYVLGKDKRFKFNHFYCFGAGAHFDTEIALSRALTEFSQSRVALISTLRFDVKSIIEKKSGISQIEKEKSMNKWFKMKKQIDYKKNYMPECSIKDMIFTVVEEIGQVYPKAVVACVPLVLNGPPYACKVYCSEMSQYHDIH